MEEQDQEHVQWISFFFIIAKTMIYYICNSFFAFYSFPSKITICQTVHKSISLKQHWNKIPLCECWKQQACVEYGLLIVFLWVLPVFLEQRSIPGSQVVIPNVHGVDWSRNERTSQIDWVFFPVLITRLFWRSPQSENINRAGGPQGYVLSTSKQ